MLRKIETALLLVGLVFYAWFLHRLGAYRVYDSVRMVGWGLAITIALETVARVANAVGWRVTIVKWPQRLSLLQLFKARIAGEAIDYTTPSAQLGGQFLM